MKKLRLNEYANYGSKEHIAMYTSKPEPTTQQWEYFTTLASQLSPENLSCNGELSAHEVNKRRLSLLKDWKQLEGLVGRTVMEDEVWDRFIMESNKKRGRIIQ